MPCILLISGSLGCEINRLTDYLSKMNSFHSVLLSELKMEDFEEDENKERVLKNGVMESHLRESNKSVKEATGSWNCNKIIYPFYFVGQLDVLLSRAYISLIEVKQPVMQRYKNYSKTHEISLEEFVKLDDTLTFKTDLYKFQNFSRHIINITDIPSIEKSIAEDFFLKRISKNVFRPSIDEYFMGIAFIAKLRSNCMKRPVGAVVVQDNRILSIGYNGTPSGLDNCYEGGCIRCNMNVGKGKDLDKCFCLHGEEAAILEVGSKVTKGATLYCTMFPCNWCSKIVVQCVS